MSEQSETETDSMKQNTAVRFVALWGVIIGGIIVGAVITKPIFHPNYAIEGLIRDSFQNGLILSWPSALVLALVLRNKD